MGEVSHRAGSSVDGVGAKRERRQEGGETGGLRHRWAGASQRVKAGGRRTERTGKQLEEKTPLGREQQCKGPEAHPGLRLPRGEVGGGEPPGAEQAAREAL